MKKFSITAFFLLIISISTTLDANPLRPKIGLVLSGGGARGFCHIGVIKVLDRLNIPVDYISGTSMGAIVGGLYASGLPVDEIEELIKKVDWNEVFSDDISREDKTFHQKVDEGRAFIKLNMGFKDGKLALPKAVIQGQNLTLMMRSLTINTTNIHDFDKLPIPFRAVAADIATGRPYIIRQGNLASAMRASMSVPGFFPPVESPDGTLLVDGGMSKNLPIDVVKAMGAEIVIAVNIPTVLKKKDELDSIFDLLIQTIDILVEQNSDLQLKLLDKGKDILIEPQMGDMSSMDFDRSAYAVEAGTNAARLATDRLKMLSLDDKAYNIYKDSIAKKRTKANITVAFIDIENNSNLSDDIIKTRLRLKVGAPLDLKILEEDLLTIYSLGYFENVDYELKQKKGKEGVIVKVKQKAPRYRTFSVSANFENVFDDSQGYNFTFGFTLKKLNRLAGQWKNLLQLGNRPRFYSEFYQPLDPEFRYFTSAHMDISEIDIGLYSDGRKRGEYEVTRFGGGVDVGREFSNWGELRAGIEFAVGDLDFKDDANTLDTYTFQDGKYFVKLTHDSLDRRNFPKKGSAWQLMWVHSLSLLSDGKDFKKIFIDTNVAKTFGKHTILLGFDGKIVIDGDLGYEDVFYMGGFLNMSSFGHGDVSGQNLFNAKVMYYKEMGKFISAPLFLGGAIEVGSVWDDVWSIDFNPLLYSGSIFAGAETMFGPLYIAYSMGYRQSTTLYLYLGETF